MVVTRIEASPYAGLWIDDAELVELPELPWLEWAKGRSLDPVPTSLDLCCDARNHFSLRFATPTDDTLHEVFFPDPHPPEWQQLLVDGRRLILINSSTPWSLDETLVEAMGEITGVCHRSGRVDERGWCLPLQPSVN